MKTDPTTVVEVESHFDWGLFRTSRWPVILFVSALIVAYGYEIFSFTLTIDEEWAGELGSVAYAHLWLAQGRWAMALLTLAVPTPVVPVVSTGLGVALSGATWWLLCRRYLRLGPWTSAVGASLAGTVPVLAFMFAFSTISFGIGIGNLMLVVYMWGLTSRSWWHRAIGVFAAAAALGIYDTFLFAVALLSLAYIYQRASVSSIVQGVIAPALALVVSKVIAVGLSVGFGVPQNSYVSQHIDIGAVIHYPVWRVKTATKNFGQTLWLSADEFGLHTPWLAAVLVVLLLVATFGAWQLGGSVAQRMIRLASLCLVFLVPWSAELVSIGPVQLRSMIYLPIMILALVSFATSGVSAISQVWRKKVIVALIASLTLLAVVGQATISNRMFSAAATSYAADQNLAFTIGQEKDRLTHGAQLTSLPLAVSGEHSWPESTLTPSREVLGASFFGWDGGSAWRISAFLRSQGVRTYQANAVDTERAWAWFDDMPVYPQIGWIQVRDGILLLNFGPRTASQYPQ